MFSSEGHMDEKAAAPLGQKVKDLGNSFIQQVSPDSGFMLLNGPELRDPNEKNVAIRLPSNPSQLFETKRIDLLDAVRNLSDRFYERELSTGVAERQFNVFESHDGTTLPACALNYE